MSFNYESLSPQVLDRLKILFNKPSTQWTKEEYKSVVFLMAAMKITVSYCPHSENKNENTRTIQN